MWNGITVSGFADEIGAPLERQIEVIKKLGISQIEMRGVNGKPVAGHSLDEVRRIKRRLDEEHITISSIGSPIGKIGITDPFGEHFELFKKTVEIAKVLETSCIRMFSFYIPEGEEPGNYKDEVFARLEKMIDYAGRSQVVLLHENEKGIFGEQAAECRVLMEQFFCDHFRAIFDFANYVQCGQGTLEAYEMMKPYISYVHVKDAVAKDARVVPAGEGDGHVEEILSNMILNGYQGVLSLEPHLAIFDGFGLLEKREAQDRGVMTGEEAYTKAYRALKAILNRIFKDEREERNG